ncbi:hypothetical protein [Novosphingobium lentum]|uniref:hypothetical protein n=1 Tax=Novosphingobium lentum TaxID=145287 RepID=UPI0008310817|nr:hypothetical protein [Novosphingobium lentum]
MEVGPDIALAHLSQTERRAYVLADNMLSLNAGWDREILAIELQALVELEFDVELTGFSLAEIDLLIDEAAEGDPDAPDSADDAVPAVGGQPATRRSGAIVVACLLAAGRSCRASDHRRHHRPPAGAD